VPVITVNGIEYALGAVPAPQGFNEAHFKEFRAAYPILPSDRWRECDYSAGQKVRNQRTKSSCFPAGTRVRMADGSEKPIEQVRPLDRVVTAEGNTGRVVGTMARDELEQLFRLHLWGHSHLRATAEHPVLTRRGYVPMAELRPGDWVAMPRYSTREVNRSVVTATHIPHAYYVRRERAVSRHNAPAGRVRPDITYIPVPDLIELTPAVGRIIGLFLAEGHTGKVRLVWTFAQDEADTLVAELVGLLKAAWGVEAFVQPRPQNHSINVIVAGKRWAQLFESLVARGAAGKRLHPELTAGSPEFLAEVFRGWMDGDGYRKGNRENGVTVSRDLALQMFDIAQALGRRPVIRRCEPVQNRHAKVRQPKWEVDVRVESGDDYRCEQDEQVAWRKVRGVVAEAFQGPVFDLTVEGDHSYVAEGVGVHNCTNHAGVAVYEVERRMAGLPEVDLSATFAYALNNGGVDEGASVTGVLKTIQDVGLPFEKTCPWDMVLKSQLPQAAYAEAADHRIGEGYLVRNFDELCSSLSLGRPTAIGIYVGHNFANLDASGVAPLPDRIAGGHAIAALRLRKFKGVWQVGILNSWDVSFGLSGYCWITREHTQGLFDAYAVVLPRESDRRDDGDEPPPVPGSAPTT
jgi:hypothetical protein